MTELVPRTSKDHLIEKQIELNNPHLSKLNSQDSVPLQEILDNEIDVHIDVKPLSKKKKSKSVSLSTSIPNELAEIIDDIPINDDGYGDNNNNNVALPEMHETDRKSREDQTLGEEELMEGQETAHSGEEPEEVGYLAGFFRRRAIKELEKVN